uniref:Transmembrane protein n=1 Tax=Cacopsylla melanoneura TaxID=428564 RepID=A0A8D8Z9Z4_9HEMI
MLLSRPTWFRHAPKTYAPLSPHLVFCSTLVSSSSFFSFYWFESFFFLLVEVFQLLVVFLQNFPLLHQERLIFDERMLFLCLCSFSYATFFPLLWSCFVPHYKVSPGLP